MLPDESHFRGYEIPSNWGNFYFFFKKVASNFFLFFKHPSRALSNLGASWSFLRLVEALEVISEVFLFLKFGWKWRFSVILSLKWFEKVKFHQNKFFFAVKKWIKTFFQYPKLAHCILGRPIIFFSIILLFGGIFWSWCSFF